MHGGTRENAARVCGVAAPHIAAMNAVVLAPQFTDEAYPGDAYGFAAMEDGNGNATPAHRWGVAVIEGLFDQVRQALSLKPATYDIVGFSGGGQFIHRLVLTAATARYRTAIAGTPGRYLFPTDSIAFPYGFADAPVDASRLANAFGRQFILVLGDADTVDRQREEPAMQQGANLFSRGLRFFAMATEEAERLGVPLRWQLRVLPGVDHDPSAVMTAIFRLL